MTIESTTKIVALNGIDCRVWEGTTERGVPIHCFIPLDAPVLERLADFYGVSPVIVNNEKNQEIPNV